MKLTSLTMAPVGGALQARADNARSRWTHRQGLLISISDELGQVGQGEASPLPGYSPDELPSCQAALGGLDPASLHLDPAEPIGPQLASCSSHLPEACPAARFALETALLDSWESASAVLPTLCWAPPTAKSCLSRGSSSSSVRQSKPVRRSVAASRASKSRSATPAHSTNSSRCFTHFAK